MHSNQTFNIITFENVAKFPIPSDIKGFLVTVNWEKQQWNSVGLPAFGAVFSVLNNELWLEENEKGEVKPQKQSFTGQSVVSTIVHNPSDCGETYHLTFEVSFCKGYLDSVELLDFKRADKQEYEIGFAKFSKSVERDLRIRKSWWFNFLYRPYYHIVKWPFVLLLTIIELIRNGLVWFLNKILFIKM